MPDGMFLGLVTHPNTRFPQAASPEGLVPGLQATLQDQGMRTRIAVHDTDEWTEMVLRIDRSVVEASIDRELEIEKHWRRYIDPSVPEWLLSAFMSVRRVYRRWKFLDGAGQELNASDRGFRMVQRLVNIEIAHMSLLRQAMNSDCEWTLIAEDDATNDDIPSLARELEAFTTDRRHECQPKYVNVSRSFNHRRLRVRNLVEPVGAWGTTPTGMEILQTRRPITNTVCAILYRTEFLATLLPTLEGIPLAPVVPIDWKLNQAIMQMSGAGQLTHGDCWLVEPAPIVQSSMRSGP